MRRNKPERTLTFTRVSRLTLGIFNSNGCFTENELYKMEEEVASNTTWQFRLSVLVLFYAAVIVGFLIFLSLPFIYVLSSFGSPGGVRISITLLAFCISFLLLIPVFSFEVYLVDKFVACMYRTEYSPASIELAILGRLRLRKSENKSSYNGGVFTLMDVFRIRSLNARSDSELQRMQRVVFMNTSRRIRIITKSLVNFSRLFSFVLSFFILVLISDAIHDGTKYMLYYILAAAPVGFLGGIACWHIVNRIMIWFYGDLYTPIALELAIIGRLKIDDNQPENHDTED